MTEKRWKIIDEEFISYTGGNAIIISNGDFKFAIWEIKEDVQKICNKLNKLVDENKKLQSINQDHCDYIADVEADFVRLEQENKKLKELVNEVDNELEDRDIVCGAGKFRLEEWGKHRYHQFYKGDEELEDETIVIMLMELEKENKEFKNKLAKVEEILNNRLSDDFQPVWDDGKTELFVEEKVGYGRALEQLKKKLIRENIIKEDVE